MMGTYIGTKPKFVISTTQKWQDDNESYDVTYLPSCIPVDFEQGKSSQVTFYLTILELKRWKRAGNYSYY